MMFLRDIETRAGPNKRLFLNYDPIHDVQPSELGFAQFQSRFYVSRDIGERSACAIWSHPV